MSAPAGAHIGILGGTFNPPHRGHLALASCAQEQLELTRIVLMPAGMPPHKRGETDPGSQHRLRMCRLASEGVSGLSVCALESERDGPSYTVDTLRDITAIAPDAKLTLIVGADTARTLPSWHEPKGLLELAALAVAAREGASKHEVLDALGSFDEAPEVAFLQMPKVEVSSSMVRELAAAGKPIGDLVGEPVAAYIVEQGLYRAPSQVDEA